LEPPARRRSPRIMKRASTIPPFARIRKTARLAVKLLLGGFVLTFASVLALKWLPPPFTAFMVQEKLAALLGDRPDRTIHYNWVPFEGISPHVALAVVAAEDQKFPVHFGFDLESIQKALEDRDRGKRLRGASTITQQVAKNLFLWPGRSYVRKALEAYFTVLIELLWHKRRILEVYLNVAQMGDRVFGVGAAAAVHFNTTPDRLSPRQAALLAAVLPNPRRFSPAKPSPYVRRRAAWILKQMRQLGGADYLADL